MATSFQERLHILETKLGILDPNSDSSTGTTAKSVESGDLSSRIDALLTSTTSRLQQQNAKLKAISSSQHQQSAATAMSSFENVLSECDTFSKSLAFTGLAMSTVDSQSSASAPSTDAAPLIYRKQEVLARGAELESAFEQLAKIRDFLSFSNQGLIQNLQKKKDGEDVSLDHVANAPIIASQMYTFATEEGNMQRLEDLTQRIVSVNDRTTELTQECDNLVGVYYKLMSTVNEKLRLYQDALE
jgi:hypothetical protein